MSLESAPLWRTFAAKASDRERVLVRDLVDHARPLLDRIPDTFPTYTLHDETHSLNIVTLMGQLLGDRIEDITALEGAILILSAYYHDIGMVYRDEEKASLDGDPDVEKFLRDNPEAFIQFTEASRTLTPSLTEWYCRSRHARRVFVHLSAIDDEKLRWSVVVIRGQLGFVCQSHNEPTSSLLDLDDDFLGQCDLRLCALLLRLADILDFDRTRTPEALFAHLGLPSATRAQAHVSQAEWAKHLDSDGFHFPTDRAEDYRVTLVAAPNDPDVEHDIRRFLDVIEEEFKECQAIRAYCHQRWRDLCLPIAINRKEIHPVGYRYGGYRFELDRELVLRLFMGENLYDSNLTFVRELAQNAIDTSRDREHLERSAGRRDFVAEPIQFRDWRDREGRQWVRVDDHGTGMTLAKIQSYFLAVGRSYYRSAEFRADQLRQADRDQPPFAPLSRFGIGVLSCFMLGDLVEISTLAEDSPPIRLTLKGLDSYYALQLDTDPAKPMPGPDGPERGYRTRPGTTIAVRVDEAKETVFRLFDVVNQYVLCPPVPVHVNGEPIPGAATTLLDRPWLSAAVYLPLMPDGSLDETGVGPRDPGGPVVKIVPYDLSTHSPDPRFRGQLVVLFVRSVGQVSIAPREGSPLWVEIRYSRSSSTFPSEFVRIDLGRYLEVDRTDRRVLTTDVNIAHNGIRAPRHVLERAEPLSLVREPTEIDFLTAVDNSAFRHLLGEDAEYRDADTWDWSEDSPAQSARQRSWVSHLRHQREAEKADTSMDSETLERESRCRWHAATGLGVLVVDDALQPVYAVSREAVSEWPWRTISIMQLAFRRALRAEGSASSDRLLATESSLIDSEITPPPLGEILDDPLIAGTDGWRAEKILRVFSVDALSGERADRGGAPATPTAVIRTDQLSDYQPTNANAPGVLTGAFPIPGSTYGYPDVTDTVSCALLQSSHDLGYDPALHTPRMWFGNVYYHALEARAEPLPAAMLRYPPGAFVRYLNSDLLRHRGAGLNLAHPLTVWLLAATETLIRQRPGVRANLWSLLSRPLHSEDDIAQVVDSGNALLDLLREVRFAPAPPRDLRLRVADFQHE